MPTKLQLFIFMMLTFGSLGDIQAHTKVSPRMIAPQNEPKFDTDFQTFRDDNLLFESQALRISKIYPNPAAEFVAFNYQLTDNQAKAKIILRNVLGKEIAIFELDAHAEKLSIPVREYVSGMYFYTLSINGENVVTRKFLVKH